MSYGRFRRDPCGNLKARARACPRCFRMHLDAARERAMVHTCPGCLEYQRTLPLDAKGRPS